MDGWSALMAGEGGVANFDAGRCVYIKWKKRREKMGRTEWMARKWDRAKDNFLAGAAAIHSGQRSTHGCSIARQLDYQRAEQYISCETLRPEESHLRSTKI